MKASKLCSAVAIFGAVVASMGGPASARDVSATSGQARIGEQEECFFFDFSTGAMFNNVCFADFIVPLTTDNFGLKNVFYTSLATTEGAVCRVVSNDRFGLAFNATVFQPIPVSTTFVETFLGSIDVPVLGVLFADCITNPGTQINHFDYEP